MSLEMYSHFTDDIPVLFDIDTQIYLFPVPQANNQEFYILNIKYDASLYPASFMEDFANTAKDFINELLSERRI
jgi:hypothetical protein